MTVADTLLASISPSIEADPLENLAKDYSAILKGFQQWDLRSSGVTPTTVLTIAFTMQPPLAAGSSPVNHGGNLSGPVTPASNPAPAVGLTPANPAPAMSSSQVDVLMAEMKAMREETQAMRDSNAALRQSLRESVSNRVPVAAVETGDEAPSAKRQRTAGPLGRDRPPRPCSHCNGDHWNRDCPTRPPRTVRFPNQNYGRGDITCYRCGNKGHRAFDCTTERTPASPRASATPPAGATPSPLRIIVNAQTGAETTFDQASWEAFQSYKKYQSAMQPNPPYYHPPLYQGHQPLFQGHQPTYPGNMPHSAGHHGVSTGNPAPPAGPPPAGHTVPPFIPHGGPPGLN
jgi:hypothetical protein